MVTARQGCRPVRRCMPYGAGILFLGFQMMLPGGCREEKQPQTQADQFIVRMEIPARPSPATAPPRGDAAGTETVAASLPLEKAREEPAESAGPDSARVSMERPVVPESGGLHAALETGDRPRPPPPEGVYRVQAGESLISIASKREVYGDELKWTRLYRLNMETLRRLGKGEFLPDSPLPGGIDLTYAIPGKASQKTKRRAGHAWVVNVISSKTQDEIVPVALQLMEGGHDVYIARAEVRGEEWLRLRVGLFRDRRQASAAAEGISREIRSKGPWVAQADDDEIRRLAYD